MLKIKEKITEWLEQKSVKNYVINENLTVDVNGDVNLTDQELTGIPVQFGIVRGDFYCGSNNLISLQGCPYEVMGIFICSYNKLINLEYCPKIIKGSLNCSENRITSLKGFSSKIGGNFFHSYTPEEPFMIKELESYYKKDQNTGDMELFLTGKELEIIVDYLKLQDNLEPNNKKRHNKPKL